MSTYVHTVTFTLDDSRYGSRLRDTFDAHHIVAGSVVRLDCPDCGQITRFNPETGAFERCECADAELMPIDVATDPPWFIGEGMALCMAEVAYGECHNTDWPDSYGVECLNPLTRDDAINGHVTCWDCRP